MCVLSLACFAASEDAPKKTEKRGLLGLGYGGGLGYSGGLGYGGYGAYDGVGYGGLGNGGYGGYGEYFFITFSIILC